VIRPHRRAGFDYRALKAALICNDLPEIRLIAPPPQPANPPAEKAGARRQALSPTQRKDSPNVPRF
jgi:hypothetical protein